MRQEPRRKRTREKELPERIWRKEWSHEVGKGEKKAESQNISATGNAEDCTGLCLDIQPGNRHTSVTQTQGPLIGLPLALEDHTCISLGGTNPDLASAVCTQVSRWLPSTQIGSSMALGGGPTGGEGTFSGQGISPGEPAGRGHSMYKAPEERAWLVHQDQGGDSDGWRGGGGQGCLSCGSRVSLPSTQADRAQK